MKILLTIAARGGSKGVKNKNVRALAGLPLIAHSIRQAQRWGRASHIVVTTDSPEIAEVAKQFGAEVPFLRPAELATDTAAKVPALHHALVEMEKLTLQKFDIVADLDPSAPVRTIEDIENGYQEFLKRKPDSIVSVVTSHKSPYFNMVEINKEGWARVSKSTPQPLVRRQDAPIVYSLNASIYFYSREFLISNPRSALSERSCVFEMPEVSGMDIDREIDFRFVEFLVQEGLWIPEKKAN